ncbi:MAG: hypothetical protein E6H51_10325 [Betaproteobacteria bacterium]|nr:MAG: hypothetical protein E6H51_10325 [Betaproteobacteria bacterium]
MGTIRRSELDGAVRGGILSAAQADRLAAFLETDATQPFAGTFWVDLRSRFSRDYALLAVSLRRVTRCSRTA